MSRDHYAILGVTPASEDVVIQAAYRALMRRYHPDADPSSEAAQKAQAINAAYAVLSDPQRRARYDGSLAAQGLIKAEPKSGRSRRWPLAASGLAGVAVIGAALYMAPPSGTPNDAVEPAEQTEQVAQVQPATATRASACDDRAVSPLLKAELFRRAATIRGADRERLAAGGDRAVVRVESARSGAGTGCNAMVAIDLPPGFVVESGRTNLNAEIGYDLADSGEQLRLAGVSGAGKLIRSLATLAIAPSGREEVEVAPPVRVAAVEEREAPVRAAAVPKPAPKRADVTEVASGCRLGNGWAERAVCNSDNLTALDRQLGLLYGQSLTRADEGKRAVLLASRDRFQQRRSACRSESCLTSTYVARLREISDIMARKAD